MRKSPLQRLWEKASTAMQDYYRRQNLPCYACPGRSNVIHHHETWGRCRGLRFDEENLVPLCQGCHCKHSNGEPEPSFYYTKKMIEKYGPEWEGNLIAKAHEIIKKSDNEWTDFLHDRIQFYSSH